MASPLFVYLVPGTEWHVIVNDDAGHFYFNSDTRLSVWQLADTGVEPAHIAGKINFDELAVLFAKARGLRVKTRRSETPSKTSGAGDTATLHAVREQHPASPSAQQKDEQFVQDFEFNFEQDSEDDTQQHDATTDLLRSVLEENNIYIVDEQVADETGAEDGLVTANISEGGSSLPKAGGTGIPLGYSSSEESDDDSEAEQAAHASKLNNRTEAVNDENGGGDDQPSGLDGLNFGSDSGLSDQLDLTIDDSDNDQLDIDEKLDLTVGTDAISKEDVDAFKELLNEHKDDISIYDPWFMVEEQLLPKIATRSAYYAVRDEATREQIFSSWAAEATSESSNKAKYPTSELLFYQFLQEHKNDVKKLYYSEFVNSHAEAMSRLVQDHPHINPEQLYRLLRVTLVDFAKYEREHKHRDRTTNLKVLHVQQFLGCHRGQLNRKASQTTAQLDKSLVELSLFERWIQLLNSHDIPESIAHDARNFVLGDEKRLACYQEALNDD